MTDKPDDGRLGGGVVLSEVRVGVVGEVSQWGLHTIGQ